MLVLVMHSKVVQLSYMYQFDHVIIMLSFNFIPFRKSVDELCKAGQKLDPSQKLQRPNSQSKM